jgi:hypothetical protein
MTEIIVKMGRLGVLSGLYFGPPDGSGRGVVSRMGYRVIEIQPTPNPNALKFVLDRQVSQQPLSFFNVEAAKDYPLAKRLFEIAGVSSILLLGDFITINKSPSSDWDDIRVQARAVLADAATAASE